MKKRRFSLLVAVSALVATVACGSNVDSAPAENSEDLRQESEITTPEGKETQPEGNNLTESADASAPSFESGYDASFNVYNYYDPEEKIVNATTYDGCFIQIGNRVLELGVSTVRDFVDAGVDLYFSENGGASTRDKEKNDLYLELIEWSESQTFSCRGSLGDYLKIQLICIPENIGIYDVGDPLDTPITSVDVELAKDGLNLSENLLAYINSDEFKPINSLYVNGGYYIGAPIVDISDEFGKLADEKTADEGDLHYLVRNFINKNSKNDPGRGNSVHLRSHNGSLTGFHLSIEDK